MTEVRFNIPYRPRGGSVRLGRAVVEVPEIPSEDAPVALEMPYPGTDRKFPYRFHSGGYWAPVPHKGERYADMVRVRLRDFEAVAGSALPIDFLYNSPALALNPFLETVYPVSNLLSGRNDTPLEVDREPMSKALLASETWEKVSAHAARVCLVNGIFFQRSPGPMLLMSHAGTAEWVRMQSGTTKPMAFPWWELERAARVYRAITGREMPPMPGAPSVLRDDLRPRVDVEARVIEHAASDWLHRVRNRRVGTLPPEARALVAETRRLFEDRFPGKTVRYTDAVGYIVPRHHSETDLPDVSALADNLRRVARLDDHAAHNAALAMALYDRLVDSRSEPAHDDVALAAAFR